MDKDLALVLVSVVCATISVACMIITIIITF